MVMEYLDLSLPVMLQKIISGSDKTGNHKFLDWFESEMLHVVQMLCQKSLSHNDLKEDNFMVRRVSHSGGDEYSNLKLVLIDFGLSGGGIGDGTRFYKVSSYFGERFQVESHQIDVFQASMTMLSVGSALEGGCIFSKGGTQGVKDWTHAVGKLPEMHPSKVLSWMLTHQANDCPKVVSTSSKQKTMHTKFCKHLQHGQYASRQWPLKWSIEYRYCSSRSLSDSLSLFLSPSPLFFFLGSFSHY
jgi:serine/threonine protein kinase